MEQRGLNPSAGNQFNRHHVPPKRRALTNLERQQICKCRLEPQHAKQSLARFGYQFPDPDGKPLSNSTLSDILKESEKWLSMDLDDPGVAALKKKKRPASTVSDTGAVLGKVGEQGEYDTCWGHR